MLPISIGLNHKGLFRICGSVTKIKALKEKYDQGEEVDLVNEGDVNSIASLLKLFLNELPVAVIPDYLCANILATFEGKTITYFCSSGHVATSWKNTRAKVLDQGEG